MTENETAAATAVEEINAAIFDRTDGDFEALEFSTNGTSSAVTFGHRVLWDTEDTREDYIEESDTYEDIGKCIRRRLAKFSTDLASLIPHL